MTTSPNADRCAHVWKNVPGRHRADSLCEKCGTSRHDAAKIARHDAPVRPLSAVLDALDAAIAEMTSGPYEAATYTETGYSCIASGGPIVAAITKQGTAADAIGFALAANMAASLSAAVRAGEAMRVAAKRVSTIAEMDVLITEFDVALAGVVAAAEVGE